MINFIFVASSENLSEDETFPKRDLANYLAAKVYYNLEEF